MQVFPERVQKLWNEWELRVLVLLSLSLQVLLVILGNRRKHKFAPWIRILVWSTYMSADWVAAVSIGILANNQGDSNSKNVGSKQYIAAFWAPFLLLHLGGPDTITAYSLEDSELWLRHMLGLVVEVGLALYVFLKSWARTPFNFLSIPIFVAGILKYGERTWVLRSTSKKNFTDSLLLDSGRKRIGVTREKDISTEEQKQVEGTPYEKSVSQAYFLYRYQFRRLYANLNLSLDDKRKSSKIMGASYEEAFKVVEMELSFMFDELYTKATSIYSLPGVILRCITFFSTVSTLVAFWLFINKHGCSSIDIGITYSLLLGAFFLEVYAFIMFILSDWTIVWFIKTKKAIVPAITSLQSIVMSDKKWSGYMSQKNLIDYSINSEIKNDEGHRFFDWNNFLEQYWYTLEEVGDKIKKPIFSHLLDVTTNVSDLKALLKHRGDYTIKRMGMMEEFGWFIGSFEFDQSILLWHVATDLYAYVDKKEAKHVADKVEIKELRTVSKHLSEYMLYLLIMCPSMMPKWIGIEECRFRRTCEEIIGLFQEKENHHKADAAQVYKLLLEPEAYRLLLKSETRTGVRQSMLYSAHILVEKLKKWEGPNEELKKSGKSKEVFKWKMIRGVWVEMLCYAASHCEWTQHAHQLRRGGEFLTHVYLLMSHLGFTQQLQTFQDQLQDPRVIASHATRAAAKDAREAASSTCKVAQVPRVPPNKTAKSLYAAAAHVYIVAAYADTVADAAINGARGNNRFIDIGAFFTATHACDAAKHVVCNIIGSSDDALATASAKRVVDAALAAMKQAAMAIAQIQIGMDPDSNPGTLVAANDAHEAAIVAREAAELIGENFPSDSTARTIANNVDIVSNYTEEVAKHADAAASAFNEFDKAANAAATVADAAAAAALSEAASEIDKVASDKVALREAAIQIDKVANDAPAVRDKLFALCQAADAVSAVATSTASDHFHQVNVDAARAVGAARLAWKAAATAIAKAQIKRNDQDPLVTASYVAHLAAHDVREAAFAARIAAYNVRSVAAADDIANKIASCADKAATRGEAVAARFDAAADAARNHDFDPLDNLAPTIDHDIDAIDQNVHAVAATASRFPTDATADFYHRVNVTTARLADATHAVKDVAAAATVFLNNPGRILAI